jgi:hypothetical protein
LPVIHNPLTARSFFRIPKIAIIVLNDRERFQMTRPLHPPKFFSVEDDHAFLRLVADLTLEETVELIDEAVRYCRDNEIPGLLVDITDVTGFPSPSTSDRFWFITKWADTADGSVALSMAVVDEMIDPDKVGVTVGTNRGLRCDVFTNQTDARRWLRATPG